MQLSFASGRLFVGDTYSENIYSETSYASSGTMWATHENSNDHGGGKTYPLSVRVLWLLPSTAGCSEQNSQKHEIKTGKRNKYNK